MRLVGSLQQEREAFRFHSYLKSVGISSQYESHQDGAGISFQVWIFYEDDYPKALELFQEFSANPLDTKFDIHFSSTSLSEEKVDKDPIQDMQISLEESRAARVLSIRKTFCTRWIIFICIIVLFWNTYERYQWIRANTSEEKTLSPQEIPLTSIEQVMLYDDPDLRGPQGVWQGYYADLIAPEEEKENFPSLTFGKIAQGQLWRLITPSFLHAGILHLLFNMLWLWILGRQIEGKIGPLRYMLFIVLVGIFSNTAQYLMSGFSFVGFSGIICGLAGYIWVRQRIAPWEGYALQKGTIAFLMIFVLGIAALQVVSFALQYLQIANFELHIANTAHLVGALSGIILARIPGFSR